MRLILISILAGFIFAGCPGSPSRQNSKSKNVENEKSVKTPSPASIDESDIKPKSKPVEIYPECPGKAEDPDTYKIYSKLIEEFYLDGETTGKIVINDIAIGLANSAGNYEEDFFEVWVGGKEHLFKNLPTLKDETYDDFRSADKKSCLLTGGFDLDLEYILVSKQDLENVHNACKPEVCMYDEYWDEFYKAYPGSHGTVNLFRIGYDTTGNQALTYIVIDRHTLSAKGRLVLLKKEKGEWKIEGSSLVWMS